MRVTEIHYEQAQNLGNYETRRVSATATLADGDDPATAWEVLKRLVWAELAQPARPGVAPSPAAAPAPAPPLRAGGTVTDKQLKAVYAIARAARHLSEAEVDARCLELYHCRPDELSKMEASAFIDTLKDEADTPF